MNDLKPCPFCGGEVYLEGKEWEGYDISCQCRNLETSGKHEVVKAWNTRAPKVEPVIKTDNTETLYNALDRIRELEAQLAEANKAKDEAREVMQTMLDNLTLEQSKELFSRLKQWLSKHGGRG